MEFLLQKKRRFLSFDIFFPLVSLLSFLPNHSSSLQDCFLTSLLTSLASFQSIRETLQETKRVKRVLSGQENK